MFDVADIGEAVVSVINNFEKYQGRFIPLCGDHLKTEGTQI
jgi:hypothetical protein